MKRRDFIQTSLLAAGALAIPNWAEAGKKKNIGIQLYSLRDVIFKDPKGVLKKVADFGYTEVETFAYNDSKIFGMTIEEFGSYTKSIGLKVVSGHYGLDLMKSDKWEKAVTDAKAIGQKYMVMPYLVEKDRPTKIDGYKELSGLLNKAGEVCNKHGIRFGYHNHAFEFEALDGQLPMDVMLQELDPKLAMIELDLYWTYRANQDPLKYFEKHPGRFEMWHVKDMDKADRTKNVEVGNGSIDFKALFAKAKQSGMKHFFIEFDTFPATSNSLQSVETSAANVRKILSK